MKKQTKVLVAATMLTLGASFSSMAALKNGTWVLNEEGWQYADKEGEYVEEEWCVSYGKEYWINDEGVLGANEWVTDGDHTYYVQSDGSKTVNAWKYIYAEDDDDADEESWFYFDAKGRMVKSAKKTIGDYKYYFDADGKMLTGWVDTADFVSAENTDTAVADVAFTNENGALVTSSWIHEFPWTKDPDECYEGDDEEYYYANSDGKLKKDTKTKIDGLYYIFDNDGKMLTGWVQEINDAFTNAEVAISAATQAAYFCDEDYGYVKTNSWRKLDDPTGDDTYWYHFDKLGKAFIATDANAVAISAAEATFEDGEKNTITADTAVVVNSKKIDGVEYYFNTKGEMIDGLQYIGGKLMYLEGGARQTGKVTLTDENENDYTFYFADKTNAEDKYEKYVAIEGNEDGYCYKQGQLQKTDDKDLYKVVETTNGKFVVDYRGKIQHKAGKAYEGAGTFTAFNESAKGACEDSITE